MYCTICTHIHTSAYFPPRTRPPAPAGAVAEVTRSLLLTDTTPSKTMSKLSPQPSVPSPATNETEELSLFNPVSKWQEHVEVPGLTLFDIHREPRRENTDPDARVRIQLKVGESKIFCIFALKIRCHAHVISCPSHAPTAP